MVKTKTYQSIPGFFVQDEIRQLPLPAVPPRFGLKDASDGRWDTLQAQIQKLNENADAGTSYKLFLLARHGQGYHNLGETKYGTRAWDDYWAKLDGDGEIIWGPDALLTPLGIEQAHVIQDAWKAEVSAGISAPHRRYCSPLTRALHTCQVQFEGIFAVHPHPVMILENCREENGVHTCDKRKSRTYIHTSYPDFAIEGTLTEEDELWHATIRETKAEVAARAKLVLDHVFEHNGDDTFISITAHSGFINGFLTAVGREHYVLPTGGVMPLVVRVQEA